MTDLTETLRAGVIGVGSMGRHHARVYRELPNIDLVGVVDEDWTRAESVASKYGTEPTDTESLLDAVDLVSIAVPTAYHYEMARAAIDHGVHLLVEKPFVLDRTQGVELTGRAHAAGLTLQVGHIERFNPAFMALEDILPDLEIIAITATRLGPPTDRHIKDDVVMDLMIHDIDVVLTLVDDGVNRINASSTHNDQYATALFDFDSGVIAALTASRVTQQKVRTLSITTEECQVNVDYAEQSVRIHRHSVPAYIEDDGGVRYRYESVIERPSVDNGEPLRVELESFAEAVRTGSDPIVTGEDGLRSVAFAEQIRSISDQRGRKVEELTVE